jgi:hypothetical protein
MSCGSFLYLFSLFSGGDNFSLVSTDGPTNQDIITPGGFNLDVQDPVVAPDSITADIGVLNNQAVFSADELDLEIDAVVCYYNPVDPLDPAYSLINLSKFEPNYDFAQVYALNLGYNINQQNIATKYQNSILYLAVATKDISGKVIQYSSTLAVEG